MTRKDKDILFVDLSARLPYGVMVAIKSTNHDEWGDWVGELTCRDLDCFINDKIMYDYIKPYLRPMSSMTEEENKKLDEIWLKHTITEGADYLNSIHVDYRGLIEKGLAIKVTKENNPYV